MVNCSRVLVCATLREYRHKYPGTKYRLIYYISRIFAPLWHSNEQSDRSFYVVFILLVGLDF